MQLVSTVTEGRQGFWKCRRKLIPQGLPGGSNSNWVLNDYGTGKREHVKQTEGQRQRERERSACGPLGAGSQQGGRQGHEKHWAEGGYDDLKARGRMVLPSS